MTMEEMEQRILVLEREVAELKQIAATNCSKSGWLERFAGAFKDDPDFDEVVRLGAEWRRAENSVIDTDLEESPNVRTE